MSDNSQTKSTMVNAGFAIRREDNTLIFANPTLHQLVELWNTPAEWWRLVTALVELPPFVNCPVCGLAQRVGTLETVLPDGDRARVFKIVFSGHAHGISSDATADVLLVHDVTESRSTLQEVNEKVDRYHAICQSIREVYYRVDIDGIILFVSPFSYKMLSYHPDELIGQSLVKLCLDPGSWTELTGLLERFHEIDDFDLMMQCKKGKPVPISLNAKAVFDGRGRPIGMEGTFRDVSEREHLDTILMERTRELQETASELKNQKFALDQHAIVSLIDASGTIASVNKKLVEQSQCGLDELKGKPYNVLSHKQHSKSFFKNIWQTVGSGRVWRGEIENRRADNALFWTDTTMVPFMSPSGEPYQYISISTDITPRIEAERRLEQNRLFLMSITDAIGEGVYVLDLAGQLLFMNREAERLLGWREAELLGRNFHDVVHYQKADGTHVSIDECPVHQSLLNRPFRIDNDCFTRKDKTIFPVSYVTTPLYENGKKPTGSVAVFVDITERQREREMLEKSCEMALEASKMKSEFLANMSHEIRTPMNAIIGMTDLLRDTQLTEEQLDFADIVRDSAASLLSIINDILDFSKIEAGKFDLENINFSTLRLVEGTADLLAPQAHEQRLSLMTWMAPDVPKILKGDPVRLRQILLNLTGNALKFTEEGEVVVRAVLKEKTDAHALVRFSVTDTGIGLTKVARKRLFKPFSQADGATTRKYGGTGLGLAISKRLVELMNGEIGVESQYEKGSIFWFQVPIAYADVEVNVESEAVDLVLDEHSDIYGMRVLLLSESPSDRDILLSTLSSWKMQGDDATDIQEALQLMRQEASVSRPFDLVIVSTALSDLDERSFAAEVRQDPMLQETKLVALSDVEDKVWEKEVREHGFCDCLIKPVRQSTLMDCLVSAIDPEAVRSRYQPLVADAQEAQTVVVSDAESAPDTYEALESGQLLLLAEDNPVNRKVALMQLKKLGYAAHVVGNGKEVVDAITHLPYALILMDCQMPVMDGFEATHHIRKMEERTGRHVPIIAMTANAMKGDRERCLNAGMDDYLSKPVDPKELKGRLEKWGSSRRREMPIVDIKQLKQLFGNDQDVIRSLLRSFLDSVQESLISLMHSVETQNSVDMAIQARELKGVCANMCAARMAQMARRMENAADESDWKQARIAVSALEKASEQVKNFMETF